MLPIVAFAAVATLVLGSSIDRVPTTRLAILAIVIACVISCGLIRVVRTIASSGAAQPDHGPRRTAAYIDIWVRRITTVGAFGSAVATSHCCSACTRGLGYRAPCGW